MEGEREGGRNSHVMYTRQSRRTDGRVRTDGQTTSANNNNNNNNNTIRMTAEIIISRKYEKKKRIEKKATDMRTSGEEDLD